jgi:1-acyl-sn-glycerol-3-phosphate acyltransferase
MSRLFDTRLLRASRRTSRTALLLADAAAYIKTQLQPLPDAPFTTLRRQAYASFVAENTCAINGFDVRVSGQLPSEPTILVCNHVGWQDPLLITSVVPSLAVAKLEVAAWPLIGELARGVDFMFVDRGSAHSGARVLLLAKTLLERGASVLTFPEGTTTIGGDVLPLRRGMFGLARLMGVAITPIALTYVDGDASWVGDETFFPSFYRTVARRQTASYLDFGTPIEAHVDESAQALAERARATIRSMLRARAKLIETASHDQTKLSPRVHPPRPVAIFSSAAGRTW